MRYKPKDEDRRREQAYQRLGTRTPRCGAPGCGESDWQCLTGRYPHILCYEHDAMAHGRSASEDQHPSGRNNEPAVIEMAGNDHRFMDSFKLDWPERTLRNPDGSPLLATSASMRSQADWYRLARERVIGRRPEFLEWLDEELTKRIGPQWWVTLGWTDEQPPTQTPRPSKT